MVKPFFNFGQISTPYVYKQINRPVEGSEETYTLTEDLSHNRVTAEVHN